MRLFGFSFFERMPMSSNGINLLSFHPRWSITWLFALQWHRISPAYKAVAPKTVAYHRAHYSSGAGIVSVSNRWLGRLSFDYQRPLSRKRVEAYR